MGVRGLRLVGCTNKRSAEGSAELLCGFVGVRGVRGGSWGFVRLHGIVGIHILARIKHQNQQADIVIIHSSINLWLIN